jgi:hypothetical protein
MQHSTAEASNFGLAEFLEFKAVIGAGPQA